MIAFQSKQALQLIVEINRILCIPFIIVAITVLLMCGCPRPK